MHVVRERYIRDDWTCRVSGCSQCEGKGGEWVSQFPALTREVDGTGQVWPWILVPDAGVIAEYTQLLTAYPTLFDNAVLPGSAIVHLQDIGYTRTLEEVRSLTSDTRRSVVVFPDHVVPDLAPSVLAGRGKKPHAGGKALASGLAAFYLAHLGPSFSNLRIIVLSNDDVGNDNDDNSDAQPGQEGGRAVEVLSTTAFLDRLRGEGEMDSAVVEKAALLNDSLVELMARRAAEAEASAAAGGGDAMFDRHVSEGVMDAGLKSGEYLQAKIQVSTRNRRAVFAVVQATGDKIFIPSLKAMNRSIVDDVVAVRILPQSAWEAPPNTLRSGRGAGSDPVVSSGSGDNAGGGGNDDSTVPTGTVVGIVNRKRNAPFIATLPELAPGSVVPGSVLAVPMDIRMPKVRITSSRLHSLFGQRLLISLDEWSISSAYPGGHVVRALGAVGDAGVEMEALLLANQIVVEPFSARALAELPDHTIGDDWEVPASELASRRDLRGSRRVASIDPPGSKDVDDALSLYTLPEGHPHAGCVEYGVHIADVTAFVAEGSVLDAEAKQRGSTVYLADRRFDMLPAVLSEDLCSLRGCVDRLAVSVLFVVDPADGFAVRDVWYGRTVIRSAYQLEYGQAQLLFDEGPGSPGLAGAKPLRGSSLAQLESLREDIGALVAFGRALKEKRRVRGALELHSDEISVSFDGKAKGSAEATGAVAGLEAKQQLEMMDIVAEFMIAANEAVAERIYRAFPESALLRRHPLPRNEAFEDLLRVAALRGYELDTSSNRALAASLSASMLGDSDTLHLLRQLATVAMSEAVYFSTGSVSEDAFYHYGLAAEYYTHYTSPIRRYADVLVHRQLLAAVGDGPPVSSSSSNRSVVLLADHLNDRTRACKTAQRDSVDLYRNLFFKLKGPVRGSGVVYSFFDNGFEVYIPEYGLRAPVYISVTDLMAQVHPGLTALGSPEELQIGFQDASMEVVVVPSGTSSSSSRARTPTLVVRLFDRVEVDISGSDAMARVGGISVVFVGASSSEQSSSSSSSEGGKDFRKLLRQEGRAEGGTKSSVVGSNMLGALGSGARRVSALVRARAECKVLTGGSDGRTSSSSWYLKFAREACAAGGGGACAAGGAGSEDGGEDGGAGGGDGGAGGAGDGADGRAGEGKGRVASPDRVVAHALGVLGRRSFGMTKGAGPSSGASGMGTGAGAGVSRGQSNSNSNSKNIKVGGQRNKGGKHGNSGKHGKNARMAKKNKKKR